MTVETFSNNATSTLDGGIDDSQTSLTITAHTLFPQSGQFRIKIDNECLLVTAGGGTLNWTVTRGAEGTTPASHSNGAQVRHTLTAGALMKFRADNVLAGAIGSRPAAGRAGALYLPGAVLQRDTGAAWDSFGPLDRIVVPPPASSWGWVNQGSATLTDSGGSLILQTPYATGTNKRIITRAAPATPYTVSCAFRLLARRGTTGRTAAGVLFRQSGDGKIYPLNYNLGSSTVIPQLELRAAASATDGTGSVIETTQVLDHHGLIWMRIADNGTNRVSSLSVNGVDWVQFHSVGRTSYLTADEIGFFLDYDWSVNPKMEAQVQIVSWEES